MPLSEAGGDIPESKRREPNSEFDDGLAPCRLRKGGESRGPREHGPDHNRNEASRQTQGKADAPEIGEKNDSEWSERN